MQRSINAEFLNIFVTYFVFSDCYSFLTHTLYFSILLELLYLTVFPKPPVFLDVCYFWNSYFKDLPNVH